MNIRNIEFNSCIAVIGSLVTYLYGGWNIALKVLVFMAASDYVTGVIAAAYRRTLSSETGFKGILKKIFVFIICAIAFQMDKALFGGSKMLFNATAYFYSANEALSILENSVLLDVPIPSVLKNLLIQVKDTSNKGKSIEK